MNRFAHKHIGQVIESAAWPKHEQQSRKHAQGKKLNRDGNRLQKLFISLLFYVFLVLTVHPSLSPVSLFHSLFPSSTFLSMLHISCPLLCTVPQLFSPLLFSLSLTLSVSLFPPHSRPLLTT